MVIASGGNVGIGTTGPAQKLEVFGNIALSNGGIIGQGHDYGTPANTYNGTLELYNSSTGNATLQSATAYGLLLNPAGGNVGIGTTAPTGSLDIVGASALTATPPWGSAQLNVIGSSGQNAFINIKAPSSSQVSQLFLNNGTNDQAWAISSRNAIDTPNYRLSFYYYDGSNWNTPMTILPGNVPHVLFGNINSPTTAFTGDASNANSSLEIYSDGTGTNPTSQLRLTSNSSATTGTVGAISFQSTQTGGSDTRLGVIGVYHASAANSSYMSFYTMTAGTLTDRMNISGTLGTGTVYSNAGTLTNTNPSDISLKYNINNLDSSLAKVLQLRPVSFNWKSDGTADYGFIAQDVQQVIPELVRKDPDTGDLGLLSTEFIPYLTKAIQEQQGEIASMSAQLANFVAQNVNAGAVIAENITTNSFTAFQGTIDNLLIKSGLVTPNLQVALISPLPDGTNVIVQIGSEATPSGQFVIQNASGSAVATIDNTGNATFSGTVNSQGLNTNSASVSGELYADNIHSLTIDQIQEQLRQVKTDQDLLNQAVNWNTLTATNSANLDQLAVSDLYITNQAAINSLSVSNTFTVGSDLVFGSDNTLNTLSAPLKIQSLAMAPLEIMDGLVTIDTKGNVQIAGDLFVAGRIHSSGLTLQDNPQSASGSAALLSLQDTNGNVVSSVNASGSAQFNSLSTQGLTIAGADATVSGTIINGVITTNSTVGTAIIPAGISEITIKNSKVTDYTLVYVTPTSTTENYVLYVKSKQDGQFTVGFTNPLDTDVNFNWWIVQVQN
jgi:hypothetical protein